MKDPLVSDNTMDATYLRGTKTTATITVEDNDDPDTSKPSVTISGPANAEEGDSLVYTITANPAPANSTMISVRVRITETGDFLTDPAPLNSPRVVNVDVDDTGMGTHTVLTSHDENDEDDEKITARIIAEDSGSVTYSIGESPTQITNIVDNDNDDLPTINISAKTSSVTEKPSPLVNAVFTLTATAGDVVSSAVDVNLIISEEGNFLATPASMPRAAISVTPGTPVDHEEPIANDNLDEPNGAIVAKIMASTAYSVGTNAVARVVVNDDEGLPTITFDTSAFSAEEGNPPDSGPNTTPTSLVLNVGPFKRIY